MGSLRVVFEDGVDSPGGAIGLETVSGMWMKTIGSWGGAPDKNGVFRYGVSIEPQYTRSGRGLRGEFTGTHDEQQAIAYLEEIVTPRVNTGEQSAPGAALGHAS